MALERRRNPLPVGRYWIDVFGDNRAPFDAWLNATRGKVHVLTVEGENSDPPHTWALFTVSEPVNWDAKRFGFPTIAPPSVNSMADTATRPPPEPAFDWGIFSGFTAAGMTPLLLFLGGLWLLSETEHGSRRR